MRGKTVAFRRFLVAVIALALLPSSVYGGNTVSLKATVVPSGDQVFDGSGYLHIMDQQGVGKARLSVPISHEGTVKMSIEKRGKLYASWEWSIVEHIHTEKAFRRHDYTRDTITCMDSDGRVLKIIIHDYDWGHSQRTVAIAYGEGAIFQGQIRPPA